MSLLWNRLIDISETIENIVKQNAEEVYEKDLEKFNKPGWVNRVYRNDKYRRAHIDIVDAREEKGLWMMHCCVFPHVHNNGPVFGYDVIAGENKITGFFHDFSPMATEDHPMSVHFYNSTEKLSWKKVRVLPDWALQIFSKGMVAAGNIKPADQTDISNFDVVEKNLIYFVKNIEQYNNSGTDYTARQNRYAFYQKQNPHTPKTMKALGLDDDDVDLFVSKCLFPEINS